MRERGWGMFMETCRGWGCWLGVLIVEGGGQARMGCWEKRLREGESSS